MLSHVVLNKVWSRAQKCHQYKKIPSTVALLHTFPRIWISTPWSTNHACAGQKQDGFILHDSFVFLYFWINISQISQISTVQKKIDLSILNDMWPHVFRSEVGSCFLYFLVTYLSYIWFLLVCGNFPLTLNTGRCWKIM